MTRSSTRLADLIPATSRRPKSLILDVYGRYAAQVRGWLPVADLVTVMELLGVDEQAVRSALSRMTRRGLLRSDIRKGVRGYSVTSEAAGIFADADAKIYTGIEPSVLEDGWVLASFSMPEDARDKRHALRSALMWLGMGSVSSGLRIGPRRILDDVVETVKSLGLEEYVDIFVSEHHGIGTITDLVNRAWDLSDLADAYSDFVARFHRVDRALARAENSVSSDDAFATYTLALHDWRKFPYLDPGLPTELLPGDWPGPDAWELFSTLRDSLEPLAFEHVEAVAAPTR